MSMDRWSPVRRKLRQLSPRRAKEWSAPLGETKDAAPPTGRDALARVWSPVYGNTATPSDDILQIALLRKMAAIMDNSNTLSTPPPEQATFSRVTPSRASADAIPILVDQTYHLFHLTTPPHTRHHPPRLRSCWWHMQSDDLVNWKRDPTASIEASDSPTAPDADGAWTGSAVLGLDGRMNVFYTGYNLSQSGKQVILRIVASTSHGDGLQGPGEQVEFDNDGHPAYLEDIDFRDPYVFWNAAEMQYWMIIASRLKDGPYWSRGCLALARSSNLSHWRLDPRPLYAPNDVFCPECPELYELSGRWYLVYSRFHAPNSGTVYRVANSPYGPFRVPRDGSQGRLDGRRWYAAKSCPAADNPHKRIYFGWIGDYVDDERKWLWGGDLAIPREVSADAAGNLRVGPSAQALSLFEATSSSKPDVNRSASIGTIGTTIVDFFQDVPNNEDVLVHALFGHCDATAFGFVFNADSDTKGFRLRFTQVGGTYTAALLTDFAPLDDFWADQYQLHLPRGVDGPELVRHEHVKIADGVTILLREHLVEAFFGGRSVSFRLPQTSKACHRLGYFVEDGSVEFRDVSVWKGGTLAKVEA